MRAARITGSQALLAVFVVGELIALSDMNKPYATYALLGANAAGIVVAAIRFLYAYLRFPALVAQKKDPLLPPELTRSFEARALADALERDSIAWPYAALALAGPLTIHYVAGHLIFLSSNHVMGANDYGEWISLSGAIVGHAHAIVAFFAVRHALRISRMGGPELRAKADGSFRNLWTIAVIAATVPSGVFFGIPPVITAVTAAALIIPMILLRSRVLRERVELEHASRTAASAAFDQLRSVAEDGRCDEHSRARAISCLAAMPDAPVPPVLDHLVRSLSPLVADRAYGACLELRHQPPLATMIAAVPEASVSTAMSLAELLAREPDQSDPRIENALLVLLARTERAVKLASIEALRRVGTVEAVEPLRRLITKRTYKKQAREAIGDIQNRLDIRAGRGQLALTSGNDDAGALSVSSEAGALSFE